MTFSDFKFECLTDSDIIIKKFESPEGGFVALAWDEVSERPYLHLRRTDGSIWEDFDQMDTWKYGDKVTDFLDVSDDFNYLTPQAQEALLLHTQIRIRHDAGEGRTGYDYLQYRPHLKLFIRKVGHFYDSDWRVAHHVADVEEIWMYDDARRTHIASFQASIEAWAIEEREVMEEGYEDSPERDIANDELGGFENWVDYFSDRTVAAYDNGPATDAEVLALMTGETSYEEFIDAWIEYFRSNQKV